MPTLAKWYRQDISVPSVSDMKKPVVTQNLTVTQPVIATCALRSQSPDLPNTITTVKSIRDTAVTFVFAVNRNW